MGPREAMGGLGGRAPVGKGRLTGGSWGRGRHSRRGRCRVSRPGCAEQAQQAPWACPATAVPVHRPASRWWRRRPPVVPQAAAAGQHTDRERVCRAQIMSKKVVEPYRKYLDVQKIFRNKYVLKAGGAGGLVAVTVVGARDVGAAAATATVSRPGVGHRSIRAAALPWGKSTLQVDGVMTGTVSQGRAPQQQGSCPSVGQVNPRRRHGQQCSSPQ